jgi:hypothetical protein
MLPNMQGLLNKGLKNTAVKEDAFPDPENIDRHPLATQTEHTLSKNMSWWSLALGMAGGNG